MGMVGEDERVVVLISGNGLKDIDSAMKSVAQPLKTRPDSGEAEKTMAQIRIGNEV